jgi:dienelactone hydrolase
MKSILFVSLYIIPFLASTQTSQLAQTKHYPRAEQVATDFKNMLRRPVVDFKASFETFTTDTVLIEKGFIYTEENERVPILIYKPLHTGIRSFPAVICLHGTGGNKQDVKKLLYALTKEGIMGVSIDARYHGERIPGGATNSQQYTEAITRAWRNNDTKKQQHPFYYDTVYDLWKLTDYLVTRKDVQASRIGMMGISMGGIEAWLAASVDKRIKVTVPVIAVQSFKWSLENNKWQGRARTIWNVHEAAAKDLRDTGVNKANVQLVWDKLVPGITGEFDCPSMLRLFAPRPLLLMNNEKDPNCPLPGAGIAFASVTSAYRAKAALDKLKIHVTPNEPHRFTPEHFDMTIAWFKKWL